MKIPPTGTNRYRVMELIYKHGPMRTSEAVLRLPNMITHSVSKAMSDCVRDEQLSRDGLKYSLTPEAQKYFDYLQPAEKYVPQIAAPRQVSMLTAPMTGYEAAMRSNRR